MPTYKQKKARLKQLIKSQQQQHKKQIQQTGYPFISTNAFKSAQKHYKHYIDIQTDYSKIINIKQLPVQLIQNKFVYIIPSPSGAFLVKAFCSVQEQFHIGSEALNRYIYRPYRTNLDGTNGLYEKQQQAQLKMMENQQVIPKQVKDQEGNVIYYFNQKIRMTNLGYQYDWPKRSYPSSKVSVPNTILKMTDRAVSIFEEITGKKIEYRGEAVIVNYYKIRDYMIGHLDDGEIDQVNPIFSFSFGLSCVFLLGYPEKQKQPNALELETGDLLIMAGESRVCYHGVPRIIGKSYKEPKEDEMEFQINEGENGEKIKYLNKKNQILNYFKSHRLNVNIRQVYPSNSKNDKKQNNEQKEKEKGEQNGVLEKQ